MYGSTPRVPLGTGQITWLGLTPYVGTTQQSEWPDSHPSSRSPRYARGATTAHAKRTRGLPRPSTRPVCRWVARVSCLRLAGRTRPSYNPGSVLGRRTGGRAMWSRGRRGAEGRWWAYRGRSLSDIDVRHHSDLASRAFVAEMGGPASLVVRRIKAGTSNKSRQGR